jgi:hypothetical protein
MSEEKKEEPKVAAVETEKVDDLLNDTKATVTMDDGKTASAKSIGKEGAIRSAAEKAKRSW